MHNSPTPNQTYGAHSGCSSVFNSSSKQNNGRKRNQAENTKLSSKAKRTAKNSTPLSDITNITILESSPFSVPNGSAEIQTPIKGLNYRSKKQLSTCRAREVSNTITILVRILFFSYYISILCND